MNEIHCKICNNGTLTFPGGLPLHLGTKGDKNCTKIMFTVGDQVEGKYRYVKFYNQNRTVLQRLDYDEVIISTNVTSLAGKWLMSFLSSNQAITYSSCEGSYIFSTIPVEVDISDGLLEINILDENQKKIEELEGQVAVMENLEKALFSMDLGTLTIPDYITSIGNYFLYNASTTINYLTIGKGVRSIGSYAFYGVRIPNISFASNSKLEELKDYAFSHISECKKITLPASLSNFGHYAFSGCSGIGLINFEEGSVLKTLLANSFNNVYAERIELPYGLTKFAANGYVFRNSTIHNLWIPNTIATAIPATAFYDSAYIFNIELQNGFNVYANFSNCVGLTRDSLVAMFNSLANRTGQLTLSITIGSKNLEKLTESDISIATNKNWTVS